MCWYLRCQSVRGAYVHKLATGGLGLVGKIIFGFSSAGYLVGDSGRARKQVLQTDNCLLIK